MDLDSYPDLDLINEVKTIIDEVIDKVPEKKDMKLTNLNSIIVFSLGCIIGFQMFVFNLFMTSKVLLSFILVAFFFIIGFLMGIFMEQIESPDKSTNTFYLNY